ncbi:MAG: hypothetical protein ACFFBD_27690 [Candidatus Hodarchaeota archaeon]
MTNKVFYLGVYSISLLLICSVAFAAEPLPTPAYADWGCNEGDTFFWIINKLRINNEVESYPVWGYYDGSSYQSINGTEGDTIEIAVLSLGNATASKIQLRIRVGENEYITPVFKSNPIYSTALIIPVFDRGYWEDVVEWYNSDYGTNQLINASLEKDLLTISGSFSGVIGSYTMVLDVVRGLLKKYEMFSTSKFDRELAAESGISLEVQIDLVEPFMSTKFESLGAFLGLVFIAAVPVIFRRRRKE